MYAGHYQWMSIAHAIGVPLSRLRTLTGGEVYAAFYFIEEQIPPFAPLESFGLDDDVRFAVALRSFKNIAVEGRVILNRLERLPDRDCASAALGMSEPSNAHPYIRFGNIFITPEKGNSVLRVAPPVGADFSRLPKLPNEENPYHLTRTALEQGSLGLFDSSWIPIHTFEHRYDIDPDRDTNGAGLVYFAQYVTFMETAERLALAASSVDPASAATRSLRRRRIAYYGNADIHDTITVRVTLMRHTDPSQWIGARYTIERQEDRQQICLSEAVKAIGPRG
jgi:probable biosynthetic protein (TIGR04098 family)